MTSTEHDFETLSDLIEWADGPGSESPTVYTAPSSVDGITVAIQARTRVLAEVQPSEFGVQAFEDGWRLTAWAGDREHPHTIIDPADYHVAAEMAVAQVVAAQDRAQPATVVALRQQVLHCAAARRALEAGLIERDDAIRVARADGVSVATIAAETGLSAAGVYKILA